MGGVGDGRWVVGEDIYIMIFYICIYIYRERERERERVVP